MKTAKKINRRFSFALDGPCVFARGSGTANQVVKVKRDPYSLFKDVPALDMQK